MTRPAKIIYGIVSAVMDGYILIVFGLIGLVMCYNKLLKQSIKENTEFRSSIKNGDSARVYLGYGYGINCKVDTLQNDSVAKITLVVEKKYLYKIK